MVKTEINSSHLVSIIIPAYNCEMTIGMAIESCLNQSHKLLEVIVIDDGSSDNTKGIVTRYLDDERVKYIYQKNKGRSSARNHGLNVARANFIQFLDSDDTIYTTKIEKQIPYLLSDTCFMVYCGNVYIDEKGYEKTCEPNKYGNVDDIFLKDNFIVIHAPLFKKNTIMFDSRIDAMEDWLYWVCSLKGKNICYIDEVLCVVNTTEVHLTESYSEDKCKGMTKGYCRLFHRKGFETVRLQICNLLLRHMLRCGKTALKKKVLLLCGTISSVYNKYLRFW